MRDELQLNPLTVTGTPSLIPGMLVRDADQALRFDGATNGLSVPDSVSDSLAVVVGGAALECLLSVPSLPATPKPLLKKSGSVELGIRNDGKLYWFLQNGANALTVVSNMVLTPGQKYHVVGVYNGAYTGAQQVGNAVQGPSQIVLSGDYNPPAGGPPAASGATDNLHVTKLTMLEKGKVDKLVVDLQRVNDAIYGSWIAPLIFADNAGAPGALVVQGEAVQVDLEPQLVGGVWQNTPRLWINLPVSATLQPGDYWFGFVVGAYGSQVKLGYDTVGGTSHKWRGATVSDSSSFQLTGNVADPFGAVVGTDTKKLALYATYTALARTGEEGRSLLYVNGVLDNFGAYAFGIGDTANAWSGPETPADLDEWSIWNRALSAVEVARHYAAR